MNIVGDLGANNLMSPFVDLNYNDSRKNQGSGTMFTRAAVIFVVTQTLFCLSCAEAQIPPQDALKQQSAFGYAKELMDRGDSEKAEILFKKLLTMYPKNGLAYYYYGQLLEIDPDKIYAAIDAYETANKIGPEEEYGLKAYVASELLKKAIAKKKEDIDRRMNDEQNQRRQQELAEQRARDDAVARENAVRRSILKSLDQKYVVVAREGTEAPGPNDIYCIWLATFPTSVPLAGAIAGGGWTLKARSAQQSGVQDVAWPATATWQDDPIRLEIRRSGQGAPFGLDLSLVDGTYRVRAANFPYPVRFTERERAQPCDAR